MKPPLVVAVVLMLTGAVMLLTEVASSGLWIALIATGIALVVVERTPQLPTR